MEPIEITKQALYLNLFCLVFEKNIQNRYKKNNLQNSSPIILHAQGEYPGLIAAGYTS